MNAVAEEIKSYIDSASMTDEEYLEHYGMPRRSGRYPWGSGEDPYQSGRDFYGRVEQMRKMVLHILIQRLVKPILATMLSLNLSDILLQTSELYME